MVIFHEYAHQIGYADEAEASFIGFMKAVESNNANVRYSGYFNALLNLLNEINKNHIGSISEINESDKDLLIKYDDQTKNHRIEKIGISLRKNMGNMKKLK